MSSRHATALLLGRHGVLIEGPSGSGKTALALELIAASSSRGVFARLVADDQVLLSACGGRLVARAPASIAGLAEARGFAPAPIAHLPAAVIDLLIRLVGADVAPRVDPERSEMRQGVRLPVLDLAERQTRRAACAIAACLGLPPFARQ